MAIGINYENCFFIRSIYYCLQPAGRQTKCWKSSDLLIAMQGRSGIFPRSGKDMLDQEIYFALIILKRI